MGIKSRIYSYEKKKSFTLGVDPILKEPKGNNLEFIKSLTRVYFQQMTENYGVISNYIIKFRTPPSKLKEKNDTHKLVIRSWKTHTVNRMNSSFQKRVVIQLP